MKVFRDRDSISVKTGEKFGLALKVQSASGYEWHVSGQPELVQPSGSEFKVASGAVGGASEQVLSFEARQAGEATLELVCKRAWDEQVHQTRSIRIKVTK